LILGVLDWRRVGARAAVREEARFWPGAIIPAIISPATPGNITRRVQSNVKIFNVQYYAPASSVQFHLNGFLNGFNEPFLNILAAICAFLSASTTHLYFQFCTESENHFLSTAWSVIW
jgi:hypothetical protein